MQRTSLDWSRFFKLFGKPPDPEAKDYKTLQDALYAMTHEFWNKTVMPHGPTVYKQLAAEAAKQKVGGYVSYLMWILYEKPNYLPEMPGDVFLGLDFCSVIIAEYLGENLKTGLSVPPDWGELAVNKALINLGAWGRTGLKSLLQPGYGALLVRWTPAISEILHLDKPDKAKVQAAFEQLLLKSSEYITGVEGSHVWMAMKVLTGT